jgi:hypothetical protein
MKINNTVVTVVSSFAKDMTLLADKADNQALTSTCAVLLLVRDSGGTNKTSMSALWALLPDSVVNTFQQAKRVNGAINAPTDKASEGAKLVRPLWLNAKNQTSLVKGLLELGITSPRALLDLVAPRKDPKTPVTKSAVDAFIAAVKAEGFNEDMTPILVFIAEKHAKQMQAMLEQAQAFQAGVLKDAAAKQADVDAKAEKAKAAKAAKAVKATERARLSAEALAEAEKQASDEKSAVAKKAHAEKIAHERATHPKKRDVIEA